MEFLLFFFVLGRLIWINKLFESGTPSSQSYFRYGDLKWIILQKTFEITRNMIIERDEIVCLKVILFKNKSALWEKWNYGKFNRKPYRNRFLLFLRGELFYEIINLYHSLSYPNSPPTIHWTSLIALYFSCNL